MQPQSQTPLILFYSQQCPYSSRLVRYFTDNQIGPVDYQCIDNIDFDEIPAQITHVPALITPDDVLLFGDEIYDTINSQTQTIPTEETYNSVPGNSSSYDHSSDADLRQQPMAFGDPRGAIDSVSDKLTDHDTDLMMEQMMAERERESKGIKRL